MQRSNFKGNNKISSYIRFDIKESTLLVSDLIDVTESFIEKNYSGIINFSKKIDSFEYIKISESHLVLLLKKIIMVSRLEKLINVNISCDFNNFCIEIEYNDGTKFDRSFERGLIKLAREAGFFVDRFGVGLSFSKAVFKPTALSAIARTLAKARLAALFEEMFSKQED